MNHYQFIHNIFSTVLQHSSEIEGRCFILPQSGIELNLNDLGQVITNDVKPKRYPIVAIMPPRSIAEYGTKDSWEDYRVTAFFLTTTYYQGTDVRARNPNTGTSQESVIQIWDRMKQAASDFVKVLKASIRQQQSFNSIRLGERIPVTPFSFTTVDRLSGVRLDMEVSLYVPCGFQDYPIDIVSSITLPQL